jgi:hypothetical protein
MAFAILSLSFLFPGRFILFIFFWPDIPLRGYFDTGKRACLQVVLKNIILLQE